MLPVFRRQVFVALYVRLLNVHRARKQVSQYFASNFAR